MVLKGKSTSDLSQRVRDLIRELFSPDEEPLVREMLRSFHWDPEPAGDERIHLDILEASAGKLEKVQELVLLAKADWRDLIMATEYESWGVPNERGRKRLEELHLKHKSLED